MNGRSDGRQSLVPVCLSRHKFFHAHECLSVLSFFLSVSGREGRITSLFPVLPVLLFFFHLSAKAAL